MRECATKMSISLHKWGREVWTRLNWFRVQWHIFHRGIGHPWSVDTWNSIGSCTTTYFLRKDMLSDLGHVSKLLRMWNGRNPQSVVEENLFNMLT